MMLGAGKRHCSVAYNWPEDINLSPIALVGSVKKLLTDSFASIKVSRSDAYLFHRRKNVSAAKKTRMLQVMTTADTTWITDSTERLLTCEDGLANIKEYLAFV